MNPHVPEEAAPQAVRFSVPGKLMLFGEYAVLHGHDAISCAFDARLAVSASPLAEPAIEIDSPQILTAPLRTPAEALGGPAPAGLEFVWDCLRAHLPRPFAPGLRLRIDADFPREWGFGSSSAVVVATLAALHGLSGALPGPLALAAEATERIRAVQGGIGSGYDAANQAVGGLIRYRMAPRPGALPEVEPLPLPPRGGPALRAAFTGAKVSTPEMVARVFRRYPPDHPLFGELGRLASAAAEAIRRGRWDEVGLLMDEGQRLHERLGTCPPDLAEALRAARAEPGILGAKLTGAGGGDSALLLARDEEAASRACARAGLILLAARPDPEGLRREGGSEP